MFQSPRSPAYSNDNDDGGGEGVCVGGFVNVCVCVPTCLHVSMCLSVQNTLHVKALSSLC